MKKQSSFAKALSAANKRLEQAIAERTAAQERLSALNAEIPALQRTIAALQAQIEPGKVVMPNVAGQAESPAPAIATTGGHRAVTSADVVVPPMDLSGMGSIPAKSGPVVPELSDDELLHPPGDYIADDKDDLTEPQ